MDETAASEKKPLLLLVKDDAELRQFLRLSLPSNYQLDRAHEMLSRKEGSIAEVAWRTGFPNPKYFSTCFRERFGQSPSMFKSGGAS